MQGGDQLTPVVHPNDLAPYTIRCGSAEFQLSATNVFHAAHDGALALTGRPYEDFFRGAAELEVWDGPAGPGLRHRGNRFGWEQGFKRWSGYRPLSSQWPRVRLVKAFSNN